jgi:hypothetical protein
LLRPRSLQEAYLHLWRYIGWLMGVDDDCNPCARCARVKDGLKDSGGVVMTLWSNAEMFDR